MSRGKPARKQRVTRPAARKKRATPKTAAPKTAAPKTAAPNKKNSVRKMAAPSSPAELFFQPAELADIARALAWLDERAPAPAEEAWNSYGGEPAAWSVLALPSARLHPHAPRLFAAAAGTTAEAIAAVLERRAYVDDDGTLRIWPWYPEEDETVRPIAKAQARALGLEMPREHLDDPYEPSHYLRRATPEALDRWLATRGVDARAARIERVPIPPRGMHKRERYEGGLTAEARATQAIREVMRTISLFQYVGDDDHEQRGRYEARLGRQLAAMCDALAGSGGDDRLAPPEEPQPLELPSGEDEIPPVGRVGTLFATARGALLDTDGALIAIDRKGRFTGAWQRPIGDVWAGGELAIANYSHVLDLGRGAFVEGDLAEVSRRLGLAQPPSTSGHDERTSPAISACGRYLLDVDESPYITRLADGITVAEGATLEKMLETPKPVASGLIDVDAIAVAKATVIDGVRFTLRSGESPVRDGRSLAFALAGEHWRFLVGDAVRERGRVLARLGAPIHVGAFSADGSELWVLTSDHAIRIELGRAPRVAAIAPIEPLLRTAERVLEVSP